MLGLCRTRKLHPLWSCNLVLVDSMKQIFLLKPKVLTPNRNGFMAKKLKWHLKAGSTVFIMEYSKAYFIVPYIRLKLINYIASAIAYPAPCAVQKSSMQDFNFWVYHDN